jgi:ATP-dependent DNA ligase
MRVLTTAMDRSPTHGFEAQARGCDGGIRAGFWGQLRLDSDGRRPNTPGMLRMRTLPAGFFEPCLPTKADTLPSGGLWLHEIKHDGFRIIARKNGAQVRLYSRPGNDFTGRFPLIVETLANLRTRSCIIDGEAVVCDDNGLAVFDRIRYRRHDGKVFLYAFDLIELNGDDLRREPLDVYGPCWSKWRQVCAGTSISRAMARPSFATPASSA